MAETEKTNTTLIRDMLLQERPREKALRAGIKSLTDIELMAILFSTGISGKSVLDLSREILEDNDRHLSKVARLSVKEFMKRYKGIGEAKALTILAALELGSRSAADARSIENPSISSSVVAYDIMRHHFERLPYEEFWVLFLSRNGKALAEKKIGQGGLTGTLVDTKIIVREALIENASSMILFHNHPSGNLQPSQQDVSLTAKIKGAAKLLDIQVADHLIISDNGYFSFNDEGKMP